MEELMKIRYKKIKYVYNVLLYNRWKLIREKIISIAFYSARRK